MTALVTVAPVFFMLALGFASKQLGWITTDQTAGLKAVVFNVLFPIMVFNALFTTSFKAEYLLLIAFMLVVQLLGLAFGAFTSKPVAGRFARVSRYLTATSDGGNACYPLAAALLGTQIIGNVVLFDIATLVICFLVVPMLASAQAGGESDVKSLLLDALKSTTVIAMLAGLVLSLLGVYTAIDGTPWGDLYTGVTSMATQAIVPAILFTLGFDMSIDRETIVPLAKTLASRIAYMAIACLVFTLLFPNLAADENFLIVAIIYTMAPPAFIMPGLVEPAVQSDDERAFLSAFISVNMIWTVVVFTLVAVFLA